MSDTPTDRLSRARSDMDEAHAHLRGALELFEDGSAPLPSEGAWRLLARTTADHTRALRELFLATLEVQAAEPPKPQRASYVADGSTYRLLRSRARECGELDVVAAVDRLEAFEGTEDDVRLVADRLRACGRHDVAASLLRNVEG